jgi:hypothetical protein
LSPASRHSGTIDFAARNASSSGRRPDRDESGGEGQHGDAVVDRKDLTPRRDRLRQPFSISRMPSGISSCCFTTTKKWSASSP